MQIFNRRHQFWDYFVGTSSEFSLETRVFHSLCLIGWVALLYNVPLNFYVGLPIIAWLSLFMLVCLGFFYYRSRVKKQFISSIVTLGILGNLFFIAVFYFNSGIDGPTSVLFALFFYLTMAMVPQKNNWLWLLINLTVVGGLHLYQYNYPQSIPKSYTTDFDRFTDVSSAYMVVVVLIYFTLAFIRKNYDQEKNSVSENTIAIERKNMELEILNTEKDKLFSIVAHDLRSPLASVQSYLELLSRESLDAEDKKSLEERLLLLTRNTNNMMSNLLSWSRSQMEGVKIDIVSLNLSESLLSIISLEKVIALEKGIELEYDIDEEINVEADLNMLQLVIRNLVNNAIKFSRSGSAIFIQASVEDNFCKVAVIDNGAGIAEDQQKDVFSFTAKSTFGTKNEKGVGLGLLLCKEFTELQGGEIGFSSTHNLGSTFYITIPLLLKSVQVEKAQMC